MHCRFHGHVLSAKSYYNSCPRRGCILVLQVYHDLVPVICDLLGGDRRRIATALLGGSLLPLAMFLSWNAVTLAVMPSAVRKRRH